MGDYSMRTLLALLLMTTAAVAQEPTEQQKHDALLKAYQLNGNSMMRWGSIDIDNEPTPIRVIPIVPAPAPVLAPIPVQEKVADVIVPERNVCTIHGLHKVFTKDKTSWHCRR